jgi:hypothetical protein
MSDSIKIVKEGDACFTIWRKSNAKDKPFDQIGVSKVEPKFLSGYYPMSDVQLKELMEKGEVTVEVK